MKVYLSHPSLTARRQGPAVAETPASVRRRSHAGVLPLQRPPRIAAAVCKQNPYRPTTREGTSAAAPYGVAAQCGPDSGERLPSATAPPAVQASLHRSIKPCIPLLHHPLHLPRLHSSVSSTGRLASISFLFVLLRFIISLETFTPSASIGNLCEISHSVSCTHKDSAFSAI
jgi:hypothetical protein